MSVSTSSSIETASRCYVVLSDTDNDLGCMINTLRTVGVMRGKGKLQAGLERLMIMHTGDLINKHGLNPEAIQYWQKLEEKGAAKGIAVKLLAGNHEQVFCQQLQGGGGVGLPKKQAKKIHRFIAGLDLFHVDKGILFIHGYPTIELLRTLLHYTEVTGNHVNGFNEAHYRKAHKSVEALNQYAYVRKSAPEHYLLYDVQGASGYYKRVGKEVSEVLQALGVDTVVHGHTPLDSGTQVDHELSNWIPGIRMIGNDIRVKRAGIGATVIRVVPNGKTEVLFINRKTLRKGVAARAEALLRAPPVVVNMPVVRDVPLTGAIELAAEVIQAPLHRPLPEAWLEQFTRQKSQRLLTAPLAPPAGQDAPLAITPGKQEERKEPEEREEREMAEGASHSPAGPSGVELSVGVEPADEPVVRTPSVESPSMEGTEEENQERPSPLLRRWIERVRAALGR